MKQWFMGAIALGLVGCNAMPFGIGTTDTTPRWNVAETRPVMVQQWTDGFVPMEEWNVDTVRIYGNGRWEAERTFGLEMNKPPVMVATGSLSPQALESLLGTVFIREGGQRFVDLPERVESGVTDLPFTRISVEIQNASHSVTADAVKPPAFTRVQSEMASATIAVPFPD